MRGTKTCTKSAISIADSTKMRIAHAMETAAPDAVRCLNSFSVFGYTSSDAKETMRATRLAPKLAIMATASVAIALLVPNVAGAGRAVRS